MAAAVHVASRAKDRLIRPAHRPAPRPAPATRPRGRRRPPRAPARPRNGPSPTRGRGRSGLRCRRAPPAPAEGDRGDGGPQQPRRSPMVAHGEERRRKREHRDDEDEEAVGELDQRVDRPARKQHARCAVRPRGAAESEPVPRTRPPTLNNRIVTPAVATASFWKRFIVAVRRPPSKRRAHPIVRRLRYGWRMRARAAGESVTATPPSLRAIRPRVDEELRTFLDRRRAEVADADPRAAPLVDELIRLVAAGESGFRPAMCYWGCTGRPAAGTTAASFAPRRR